MAPCCGAVASGRPAAAACRSISPARMALSSKPAARRACGRMMGQTGGRTPYHFIVPASLTTYACSSKVTGFVENLRICMHACTPRRHSIFSFNLYVCNRTICGLLTPLAYYAEQSLRNGRSSIRPSVRPSVCHIDRQQQRRAAGLLLSSGACRDNRKMAAGK